MIVAGGITEIVGRLSSGRTSLFTACLRDVTQRGALAAIVDSDRAFDPASAARAGVDLSRVLWVCGDGRRDLALRATDLLVRCPGFALVGLDLGETPGHLTLASTYRWKLAVRRTGTALVVIARRRIIGAGAVLAVETRRRGCEWAGPGPTPTRLARIDTDVHILRSGGAGMLAAAGVARRFEWRGP